MAAPAIMYDVSSGTRQKYMKGLLYEGVTEFGALARLIKSEGNVKHGVKGTFLEGRVRTGTIASEAWGPFFKPTLTQPNLFETRTIGWTGRYSGYFTDMYSMALNGGDEAILNVQEEQAKAQLEDWNQAWAADVYLDKSANTLPGLSGLAAFIKSSGTYMGASLAATANLPYVVDGSSAISQSGGSQAYAANPRAYWTKMTTRTVHGQNADPRKGNGGTFFGDALTYEHALDIHQNKVQHVTGNESKLKAGYTMFNWMGHEFHLDRFCPSQTLYYVDLSTINLEFVYGEDFKARDIPANPDLADISQMWTICQMWCKDTRKNGKITSLTLS